MAEMNGNMTLQWGGWQDFTEDLACPDCKKRFFDNDRPHAINNLFCRTCEMEYGFVAGNPDLRINTGEVAGDSSWQDLQMSFEKAVLEYDYLEAEKDLRLSTQMYEKVPLAGKVLDVGGSHGLLRQFLDNSVRYLCLDPMKDAPQMAEQLGKYRGLVRLYPFIFDPYAFICGFGEALPIVDGAFDWVHCRSVLDHMSDPQKAVQEFWRVLKPGGKVFINMAVVLPSRERGQSVYKRAMSSLLRQYRVGGLRQVGTKVTTKLANLARNIQDGHLWTPDIIELEALLQSVGFRKELRYWLAGEDVVPGDVLIVGKK